MGSGLGLGANLVQQEGVVEGELLEVLIAVGGRKVARFEIHLEEDAAVAEVGLAQALHPLGGFPVGHARVVEARGREDVRVGLRRHVVHWAVHAHVVVVLGLVRVAPLLPLANGERDARVAHGDHEVHEGHARDGGGEEVRPHVQHGAHEEAAGAAALAAHLLRHGIAAVDEVLRTADEVVEGVHLVEVLAHVLVPGAAHFRATADMSDGVGDAAVQQREPRRRERRVHRGAVAAVAVEVERHGLALHLLVLAVHERDGDLLSVVRRSHEFLRRVERGVVVRNLLLLDELEAAVLREVVEGRRRRDHAGVANAYTVRFEFCVRSDVWGRRGLREGDLVALLRKPHAAAGVATALQHVHDPNAGVAAVAAGDGDVVLEAANAAHHARAGRRVGAVAEDGVALGVQERLPVLRPRGRRRGHGEPEVLVPALIGHDIEVTLAVVHVVQYTGAARGHNHRLRTRLVQVDDVHLGRFLGGRLQQQVTII
mmetsp:Transcript_8507/g.24626  ORF Transcript_8507/g.24626 Transcript_8507/m.24626 type:complete len:484 (+) Transcript_8507:196-1647(+)